MNRSNFIINEMSMPLINVDSLDKYGFKNFIDFKDQLDKYSKVSIEDLKNTMRVLKAGRELLGGDPELKIEFNGKWKASFDGEDLNPMNDDDIISILGNFALDNDNPNKYLR